MAQLLSQAHRVEDRRDAPVELAAPREPVEAERLRDDRTAGHARVERGARILEHHVQPPAKRA